MMPGSIVVVDWRDAMPDSGEPSKQRPAVVIGRGDLFHADFSHLLVVPLTSDSALRVADAAVVISPTEENYCAKECYALSWSVQTVPKLRVHATEARVTSEQLDAIRDQVARLVER